MRFAIVGAGAIGGFMGARLNLAGQDVSLIARGAHLEAMGRNGLHLIEASGEGKTVYPFCTDNPAEIGEVDVVLITLKAHQLPAMAESIAPLLGRDTIVVSAMNGLPWWYFQRHGGSMDGTRLETLDPDGVLERIVAPERVIGCEVLPSAEIVEPGVVRHVWGRTFPMGELDGSRSERIENLAAIFALAGFKAPISEDIRHDIWVKLMGNLAFNPISALTRATLAEMATHHHVRKLVWTIMQEALTVCRELGLDITVTPDRRIEGARKVGAHKTSMLQDFEAGKPLELECIVGAVLELGEKLGIHMPQTLTVYAMTKLLVQVHSTEAA